MMPISNEKCPGINAYYCQNLAVFYATWRLPHNSEKADMSHQIFDLAVALESGHSPRTKFQCIFKCLSKSYKCLIFQSAPPTRNALRLKILAYIG